MTTQDNNSAIDDKKENNDGFKPDFKEFIKNYFVSLVFTITIGIFVVGSIGLYTTKIAQANILPDNIELAPFTLLDRIVNDIPIDINIMKPSIMSEAKECFSQKAVFNSKEYLDSFDKSILCLLKKSADPNSGAFANAPLFFSHVYENIIAKNFFAINSLFYYLSYLPESLIMLVYGLFGIFIWFLLFGFNFCISVFYHFVNIPQLFRSVSDSNKWEENDDISFIRPFKFLFFFFLWLPIGCISAFVSPAFFTMYGLIAPLFATYNLKQTNKKCTLLDFIKDTFAYKKFFLFMLATVSLISNGVKYLGKTSLIGIIIAIIFAYIMGLYNNEMPLQGENDFTTKIRQNPKQAIVEEPKLSHAKLVKICEEIPMDNKKMSNIIANGTFRQLTKPSREYDSTPSNVNDNEMNDVENMNVNDDDAFMPPPTPLNVKRNDDVLIGGTKKNKTKKYNFRLV